MRVFLACLVLQASPTAVYADLVILRTGIELKGSVVDREEIAAHPTACVEVRIVLDSTSDLPAALNVTRIPVEDIQYVVLEDVGQRHLVDFTPIPVTPIPVTRTPQRWGSTEVRDGTSSRHSVGILLTSLGLASFAVGAFLKGVESSTTVGVVGFDGTAKTGKSHDGVALTLMGVGGAAAIAGIVLLSTPDRPRGQSPRVTAYSGEAGAFGAEVVLYRH